MPEYVNWLRHSSPYINAHRDCTFVEIPHMTCDDYTRAAGSGEFLTSGDIDAGLTLSRLDWSKLT